MLRQVWATSLCLLHPVQARDMNMKQRRMMQQKVSVTKEAVSLLEAIQVTAKVSKLAKIATTAKE
jgi:hypothetical protein